MSGGLRVAVRHRANSRRRQRGAVAVEFALITPVLIMLLIGTITTGFSYAQVLGVTNAVREGARFGAIADVSSPSWGSDVVNRVWATEFNDVNSPVTHHTSVCAELWKGGTMTQSYCQAASGPGLAAGTHLAEYPIPSVPAGVCVVRVIAARNFTIQAPPLYPGSTQTMVRGSVARYEGTSC